MIKSMNKRKENSLFSLISNSLFANIGKKINADIGEEDHGGYGFKLIKQKYNN